MNLEQYRTLLFDRVFKGMCSATLESLSSYIDGFISSGLAEASRHWGYAKYFEFSAQDTNITIIDPDNKEIIHIVNVYVADRQESTIDESASALISFDASEVFVDAVIREKYNTRINFVKTGKNKIKLIPPALSDYGEGVVEYQTLLELDDLTTPQLEALITYINAIFIENILTTMRSTSRIPTPLGYIEYEPKTLENMAERLKKEWDGKVGAGISYITQG